jgi:hypothetical protein
LLHPRDARLHIGVQIAIEALSEERPFAANAL